MVKLNRRKIQERLEKKGLRAATTRPRGLTSGARIMYSHTKEAAKERIPARLKGKVKIIKLKSKKDKRKKVYIFVKKK